MESLKCFVACSKPVGFSHLTNYKDQIQGFKTPVFNPRPTSLRSKSCSLSNTRLGTIFPRASGASQVELTKDQLFTKPAAKEKDDSSDRMETLIKEIKNKFRSMDDGETSPSAYDTAWVARIKSESDPTKPQFPTCLDWVRANQLEDGSWGEPTFYLLYDRLVNTLSCVLALKMWNAGHEQIEKGLEYLRENMEKIEEESRGLITVGFELVFPWMLNEAKDLGLDLPYDLPCLQDIFKFREKKMKRIPIEVMHSVHTTLLYNLEGLQDVVQWNRILNLQSRDGSFLSGPAATAVAYMHTKDKKCLEFLTFVVNRFGDSVPCQYPIDLLERIWAVDAIQRLGIDHHFSAEISDVLDYVYANAGKEGTSWGRDNPVPDIDDTCMALRLMRLHGYPVSSDVLEYFKDDDGNLICFPGQTHRGVSDMYNLYRYTQVGFPGEKILKDAKIFVLDYLHNCVKNNDLNDKWSLKKSLDKEVKRVLEVGWRESFNRLEAREYVDQYGENDVWIAKNIYWMYNVNDPRYLELAKLDYNKLQVQYTTEINSILEWWNGCGFDDPLVSNDCPKETHFAISATLYEPQYAAARVAYTKCNCIENLIKDLFENHDSIDDLKLFTQAVKRWDKSMIRSLPSKIKATFFGIYETMNEIAVQVSMAQDKDMRAYLHDLRVKQIEHYMKKREMPGGNNLLEEMEDSKTDFGVAVRIIPALFLLGERLNEFSFRSLDHNSEIQNHLSSFLSLFTDIHNHKDLVVICANEKNISEKEAVAYLNNIMEEDFDELAHDVLKPGLVPRICRRLMLEHARVVQYFNSEKMRDQNVRKEVIQGDMKRMFTPI
ncbi:hypothetical protein LUZ60_012845 [Juncus effusus]|nr:hypothetical protein LUZ60_012845 [Juncus effusus]